MHNPEIDYEQWDPDLEIYVAWVKGYEGLYTVDWDSGAVRSVDRVVEYTRNGVARKRSCKGKQLRVMCDEGYSSVPCVTLSKNGVAKIRAVKYLVAEAFDIPKESPNLSPLVCLDGDEYNCAGWNLSWGEPSNH